MAAGDLDPSFRVSSEDAEKLIGLTGLRARKVFESHEPAELENAVEELFRRNVKPEGTDWTALTHRVMRGVVENLSEREDSDWAIRRAAQRAVVAVAKHWGNVVSAGKASVVATREAACNSGMDTVRAAQQAGLGAMEGALLVGPIAYPVLQREITPMVEDFSEVLAEERRSGEWMLRSLERGLVELPLLPPPLEQEADTPHQPEPVAEVPPEPELELQAQPQPTVPAVAQAAPAPAPGIWKRFTRWLGRLFGR